MLEAPPIAVSGDWHGDSGWALTAIRSAAREGARTAVHVGDFGLDWPGAKRGRYEAKLNKYLVDLELTLVVSGGNHDNWDTLAKLNVESDGLATIRSNIRVLPRGGRTTLEGLTVGGLGGAFSVDYQQRTEGKDWWQNRHQRTQPHSWPAAPWTSLSPTTPPQACRLRATSSLVPNFPERRLKPVSCSGRWWIR
jgi:hypothetical protein